MSEAQEFYNEFQSFRSELINRLDAESNPSTTFLNQAARDLQLERKKLNDATMMGALPAYDRRSYESQLQALESRLKTLQIQASSSKGKFSFKKREQSTTTVASSSGQSTNGSPTIPTTSSQNLEIEDSVTSLSTLSSSYPSSTSPSDISFGPATSTLLTNSTSSVDIPDGRSLTISSLSRCIVDLRPKPNKSSLDVIRAVHIKSAKDTLIILGDVRGSVLVHDLINCTVVVACHQLRIHTSRDTYFFVHVTSNAVIEDCNGLSFGAYPYCPPLLDLPQEVRAQKSMHHAVQDFSHLKSTPSPHWSSLPDSTSDSEPDKWAVLLADLEVLRANQEIKTESSIKEQLDALLSIVLPYNNSLKA